MRLFYWLTAAFLSFTFANVTAAPPVEIGRPDGGKMPAQIAVAPIQETFPLQGGRPHTGVVRVINLGDKPITIDVSVYNWRLDESGNVVEIPPDDQSMDNWMLVYPMRFTIDPKGVQTIRYQVRPPENPAPGEHRAVLFLTKEFDRRPDAGAPSVQVRFRIGVTLYGLVDPVVHKGKLTSVRMLPEKGDRVRIDFTLLNEGNASFRMQGEWGVWKKDDFPGDDLAARILKAAKPKAKGLLLSGKLPGLPALPGERRTVSLWLAPPDGGDEKILWLGGKLSDGTVLRRKIPLP